MSSQNLFDFLASPKKCTLKFRIVKQLSEDEYNIADGSQVARLLILEQFRKGRKHLSINAFVRVVFPSTSSTGDTIILDDNSTLVPCAPFTTVEVEEDEGLTSKIRTGKIDTPLGTAEGLSPGDMIGSILIKYVHSGPEKKVGNGKVCHATIKDKHGTKNILSLWNQKISSMKIDKVYRVTNVRVENYPPDQSKKHLTVTAKSTVSPVEDSDFDTISVIDETFEGLCVGVSSFYFYLSCPSCFKKVDNGSTLCPHCKANVTFPQNDYKCEVLLQMDEDIKPILAFKQQLDQLVEVPNVLEEANSEVERRVNEQLDDKKLIIGVVYKRDNTPTLHSASLTA